MCVFDHMIASSPWAGTTGRVARLVFALFALVTLTACVDVARLDTDQDSESSIPEVPKVPEAPKVSEVSVRVVERFAPADRERIPPEALDLLNRGRVARGLEPLVLDARLMAAAAVHARDMSLQNRPWHFGSDGSSPPTRIRRTGYEGRFLGEVIAESYDDAQTTLKVWLSDRETQSVVFAKDAKDMGIAWYQEDRGKLWWVMVLGGVARKPEAAGVTMRPRPRPRR